MANNLTGLIPHIYAAINVVSREQIGYIPAVSINAQMGQTAGINQEIRVPVPGLATSKSVVPSMTIPEGEDQDIGYTNVKITNSESTQVPWPGEDSLSLSRGAGMPSIFGDQMQEAFRKLANDVEKNVHASYKQASRAYGSAGTTPFASGVSDSAQTRKILRDNGATGDLRLVLDSTAGANVRSNMNLTKVNEAGTSETLRAGSLLPLSGITLHETQGDGEHVKGTGTGYKVNDASGGLVIGSTKIPCDTGAGTIVPGDVITFAGDATKYIAATDLTATPGFLNIAAPGLKNVPADDAAISVGDDYGVNMAFSRSAIILVARAPAVPPGGDAAKERMTVVDPVSGLAFDVSRYVGYKKAMIDIAIAYGSRVIKPEHTCILLG